MKSHDEMHGPTPREQEIIRLSELGFSCVEIGQKLGLKPDYVKARIFHLSIHDTGSDRRFFEMIRKGSSLLLRRIHEVYG